MSHRRRKRSSRPPASGRRPATIPPAIPIPPPSPAQPASQLRRWPLFLAAGALCLAVLAAYANSFGGPFVFDGGPAILENLTIRHLFPLWRTFAPPANMTVTGRPLANFSFALNYAISGRAVWSYHAFNLAIHIAAALVLFGLVRRTLNGPRLRERFGRDSLPLAFAIALLWGLHPLQTEAVTYVVQRVASMMSLFFLLTFYCVVRAAEGNRTRQWSLLAILSCLIAVGTKEIIAVAPVLLLFYDRTFLAGSFRSAWRSRKWLYLALAATWIPLAGLVASTGWDRNGTSGFDVGIKPWAYWLTQFEAVNRYLFLSVWPHPQVFEYGTFFLHHVTPALPYVPLVVGLVALTVWALVRHPIPGFLGAWFFAILAPTSVMPGRIQMIVEHRMYLPLAAVVALAATSFYRLAGRRALPVMVAAAVALGVLTEHRNQVYRSALALWTNTVALRPQNDRAHNELGNALVEAGRVHAAIAQYEAALRIRPTYPEARSNLGNALLSAGHVKESIKQCEIALKLEPSYAQAHNNLGDALLAAHRIPEAIAQGEIAVRLRPNDPKMHYNLGDFLMAAGRIPEAVAQYRAAEAIGPPDAKTEYNLGNALYQMGQLSAAVSKYREAVRIKPDYAEAYNNLGNVLLFAGHPQQAIAALKAALRVRPNYADAANNLGAVYAQTGQIDEAIAQFKAALRMNPHYTDARRNLERMEAKKAAARR